VLHLERALLRRIGSAVFFGHLLHSGWREGRYQHIRNEDQQFGPTHFMISAMSRSDIQKYFFNNLFL